MGKRQHHVVCMAHPIQGHIKPMLILAKLLHSRYNFHVSFVNTEHNHRRFLKANGPAALAGVPSFRFYAIPDGLQQADNPDASQPVSSISTVVNKTFPAPFRKLLSRIKIEEDVPPVSCIVSDAAESFVLQVAAEIRVPVALFWTSSACSFLGFAQYQKLVDEGITPLPDASCLTNGYLDKVLDWIPSMKGISLKHLPSFLRTQDIDDPMFNLFIQRINILSNANCPIILNTFQLLDKEFIDELATTIIPSPILSIGPLSLLLDNHHGYADASYSIRSNLWKEDSHCIPWLDNKPSNSVIYVNFGSITVLTHDQLAHFAHGLLNSMKSFLWVVRPDLVEGESSSGTLIRHLVDDSSHGRGMLASWCDQDRVLAHPAVGAFMTHCGWNSTLEAIVAGKPVLCWPFFSDQMTNAWLCCEKLGIGAEIGFMSNGEVRSEEVERLVRIVMEDEEMRREVRKWKTLAHEATETRNSSSLLKLDELVNHLTSGTS
uniref:Glycosyltransferase n=1 Tax=Fagopyrum esculentum TaxID=3617 RepID=A0A0A1HA06_FAGES|nr:UDP-glycose: glycosyltransferase UGT85Z1 [Fagopyrum esculentum]